MRRCESVYLCWWFMGWWMQLELDSWRSEEDVKVLIELRSERRQGERGADRRDRELSVPCSPDRKLPVSFRLSLLPLSALTSPRPADLVTFYSEEEWHGSSGYKKHTDTNTLKTVTFFPFEAIPKSDSKTVWALLWNASLKHSTDRERDRELKCQYSIHIQRTP